MKKITAIVLCLIIVLSLTACKDSTATNTNSDNSTPVSSTESVEEVSSKTDIIENTDNSKNEDTNSTATEITTSSKDKETTAKPSSNKTESSKKPSSNSNSKKPSSSSSKKPASSSTSSKKPSSSSSSSSKEETKVTKLTAKNINDIKAIDSFTGTFNMNLYTVKGEALHTGISYSYGGKKYYCGEDEYRIYIALLNNSHIEKETFNTIFFDKSLDDVKRHSYIVSLMCGMIIESNANILHENIVIDSNKSTFLEKLESYSKDVQKMIRFVNSFYTGTNQYFNYGDDIVIDYYVNQMVFRMGYFHNNSELNNLYAKYSQTYNDFQAYIETLYKNSCKK